jgi:hypothetical protein
MAAVRLDDRRDANVTPLVTRSGAQSNANRFAVVCSSIVVALMAVESLLGLLVHGLYREDRWAAAAFPGNDLVTLVVVAPLLGVALVNRRRSPRWTVVWLGALFYSVYNFAYYAFGANFNDVFLLHVATLTLSLAALVALVANLDVDAIAGRLPARRADRVIAAYMTMVGAALLSAWGGLSLRCALTDQLPDSFMPPTAVHLVYALDLSLLAPAFIAGGLLLWRRRPWGFVLGVAVNVFAAAYLLVLEFVGGFEANAGVDGTSWISPPAIVGAVLSASAAIALGRRYPVAWPSRRSPS